MAPLEAIIQGQNHDFNSLKEKVWHWGYSNVLYDLAHGTIPYSMKADSSSDRLIESILEKGKTSVLSYDEREWIENLAKFYTELRSFNSSEYESLDKEKKHEYALRQGTKFVELMKPLLKGYQDPADRNCPSCPKAMHGVTQESWETHIGPERYFKICNNMPFGRGPGGEIIPPRVHHYGKGFE